MEVMGVGVERVMRPEVVVGIGVGEAEEVAGVVGEGLEVLTEEVETEVVEVWVERVKMG